MRGELIVNYVCQWIHATGGVMGWESRHDDLHPRTHICCTRARATRADTRFHEGGKGKGGERQAREKREMAGKESSNSTKLRHYAAFVLTLLLLLLLLGG